MADRDARSRAGPETLRRLRPSLAWVAVWAFWLVVTRDFHPTFGLALIVTTSLVLAYAIAATINQQRLIPRYWATRRGRYVVALVAVMVGLTAAALAIIRVSYHELWGPDPDPLGTYRHFAIDLVGMAVHVAAAAGVAKLARKRS